MTTGQIKALDDDELEQAIADTRAAKAKIKDSYRAWLDLAGVEANLITERFVRQVAAANAGMRAACDKAASDIRRALGR